MDAFFLFKNISMWLFFFNNYPSTTDLITSVAGCSLKRCSLLLLREIRVKLNLHCYLFFSFLRVIFTVYPLLRSGISRKEILLNIGLKIISEFRDNSFSIDERLRLDLSCSFLLPPTKIFRCIGPWLPIMCMSLSKDCFSG